MMRYALFLGGAGINFLSSLPWCHLLLSLDNCRRQAHSKRSLHGHYESLEVQVMANAKLHDFGLLLRRASFRARNKVLVQDRRIFETLRVFFSPGVHELRESFMENLLSESLPTFAQGMRKAYNVPHCLIR